MFNPKLRISANQRFWNRCWLNQEEPMEIGGRDALRQVLVKIERRHDVHQHDALDPVRMIERHAMRHARAPPRMTAVGAGVVTGSTGSGRSPARSDSTAAASSANGRCVDGDFI